MGKAPNGFVLLDSKDESPKSNFSDLQNSVH
jgi:hypothetical protein